MCPRAPSLSRGCHQSGAWNSGPLKAHLGENPLPSSLNLVVGRTPFIVGHEAKGLSSSLAVGLRPPSLLGHGGLSIRQLATWQVQANETIGGGTRGRSRSLGNLFPEMMVHLFCCIMFVGSKSLGPAHAQGQWIIQKHGSQEAAIPGSHRESCPPHPASSSTLASLLFNTRDRPLSQLVCSPHALPT